MTFFDNFMHQCRLKGVKPTRALQDAGLNKALYSKWSKQPDRMPMGDTMRKLCDYFGCSYESLETKDAVSEQTDVYTLLDRCIRALPKRDREHLLSYVLFTYREDLPYELQTLRQANP